jgi:alpha-ribazole phosphatase
MTLWLVRHAQPLIAPGLCYGQLDVPADAAATADCARRLALELPAGIDVIASPLQRCAQLACALQALRPDLRFHTDVRLQEMDFGRWEGRAWNTIDPAELQAWTDHFAHYAVGGTGESVTAFMARVGAAFDALAPDTLWITHAGVIRAAGLLAQGMRHIKRADQWPLHAPNYGQWQTLDLHAGPANPQEAHDRPTPTPGSACI